MAPFETGSLESLQVLLQQNPDSLTFAHVADVLLSKGRLDEATQICEEGIRRHPYYVTGHMVLGKCYLQKKQFDQAEKEFKRVLLFDSKYLAAQKHFGDLMRQMGWENTCEMSYRKILQIDPLEKTAQAVLDELARSAPPPEYLKEADSAPAPPPYESMDAGRSPLPKANREAERERVRGQSGWSAPVATPPPASAFEPPLPRITTPPPISMDTPIATAPVDEDELLATSGLEEEQLLRKPQPEDTDRLPPQKSREMDEDKFASILDDIFQDEVVDERDRVERPPHLKPPAPERDFDRGIGLTEPVLKPPERAVQPEKPPVPRPAIRPAEEVDEDLLGPARRGEPPPSFTANLSFDEPPTPPSNLEVMDIEGLEPEPPEEKTPPLPHEKPAPPPERPRASVVPANEREKIVTPTLGEIYAAQGQFAKAIGVFELLVRKDPSNRAYRDKIEYLKRRLQETEHAG